MAGLIWDQLIERLGEHKLQFTDLPEDEALLYGTLAELGFYSLLDRAKLRKEINQKRKDQMLVVRDDAQRAAPFDSHTGGGHRLPTAGRNGLVVARRSAFVNGSQSI